MKKPFQSFQYDIKVLTPVHIGSSKENQYIRGQDFFFEAPYIYLVDKSRFYKALGNKAISEYSNALINNDLNKAEEILNTTATDSEVEIILVDKEELVGLISPTIERADTILKHICDGFGKLIIPGSSLKGAIRSIIANHIVQDKKLMYQNDRDDRNFIKNCFGGINDNMMRFLQVTDISFDQKFGQITAFKIFSGDTDRRGNTEGYWKHSRQSGHQEGFNPKGFVTHAETLPGGSTSTLRLNWAVETRSMSKKKHPILDLFIGNKWMDIARQQMNDYLEQEIVFFNTFKNDDFDDAVELLQDLKAHNKQANSVVIRLGAGSGYHSITGNWKFNNHTQTGKNPQTGQINFKTRKVGFDKKLNKNFPGFLKISIKS